MLDGVRLIGDGSLAGSLWSKPSISVLAIDAPPAARGSRTAVARARAKISARLAPGDEPLRAYAAINAHLERHVSPGVRMQVTLESAGAPCVIDTTGPVYDVARAAWTTDWDGTAPVDIGIGGSVPVVAILQSRFPRATMLVTGIEDPYCAAHGPNESLHLAEFARTCLAEALLLHGLADGERT